MLLFISAECSLFLEKQRFKRREFGRPGVCSRVLTPQILIYRNQPKKNQLSVELPREVTQGRTSAVVREEIEFLRISSCVSCFFGRSV